MQLIAGIAADGELLRRCRRLRYLRAIIRRWVLGFHAALYREFLNAGQGVRMTVPPLAEEKSRDNLRDTTGSRNHSRGSAGDSI